MSPRHGSHAAVFLLFLLSGATALVYEVVWLRQLILIFGSTQFATSTILATFMGGLALGAVVAGRWLGRSRFKPLMIYGGLEIGIGLYALAVPTLFGALSPIYERLWAAGASEDFVLFSLAKFVGIAAVLLLPTILMGASLPVLARQVADDRERIGGKVGGLYAVNIFGAIAGVFIAGFLAVPGIGVQLTIWITAMVNILLGATAIFLARGFRVPEVVDAGELETPRGPTSGRIRLALAIFALSGFGALVLEVAWTRVLSLILGSSVYAFSLMLLAFLTGLAVGGACFSAWLRRRPTTDPARLLATLLAASGLLAYGSALILQFLPWLFTRFFIYWNPGPSGWFVVQFVFGLLVMFPTTFVLGGIFPTVLQIHARSLARVAGSVGTVYASNTVGTIVGAAVAGFVMIPRFGVLTTVVIVASVQIVLATVAALAVVPSTGRTRIVWAAAALVAVVGMHALKPDWNILVMNSGVFNLYGRDIDASWESYVEESNDTLVIYEAEGLTASVFVAYEPEHDNYFLSVNGKVEASTRSDLETQLLSAHLPLLFHDDPRDVMIIGLASGITAGAAATHPIENLRILEIEKTMVPAARIFDDFNDHVLDDPRVSLSFNDARNELEFSPRGYDVLISEPSNPWMTIAANLFTEEFFRLAKTRIKPGGIFCQWVQNYYMPTEDMRSIIAAFRDSFPHILLFETTGGVDLLLLGSQEPLRIDLAELDGRMSDLRVRMDLGRVRITTPVELLASFRLGDAEIDRMVAGAARNTDDNARVEFSAPRSLGLYTIDDNLSMLRTFNADPLDYMDPPPAPDEVDTLRLTFAAAWASRGNKDLAEDALRRVANGPLAARADELMRQIRER